MHACRTRLHTFDPECVCGEVKCNSGCGDFSTAEPAEACRLNIIQQGGLSETEVNAVLVEEREGLEVCTRSTKAYHAAKAFADAVIIVAPEGATEFLAAVDSKSAVAQAETLQLENVNIPVGLVSYEDGALLAPPPSST